MTRPLRRAGFCLAIGLPLGLLSLPALADYRSAMEAFHDGRLEQAAVELTELAEAGDADAQSQLAFMYERGLGVTVDPGKATYWRRRAAITGDDVHKEMYWQGK